MRFLTTRLMSILFMVLFFLAQIALAQDDSSSKFDLQKKKKKKNFHAGVSFSNCWN